MELNDTFRRDIAGGSWTITAGVKAEGPLFIKAAIESVRSFDAFSEDNDPYGEHDFGSFTILDHKLFWKIDYYGLTLDHGSENSADPAVTRRVMTIMLANEY